MTLTVPADGAGVQAIGPQVTFADHPAAAPELFEVKTKVRQPLGSVEVIDVGGGSTELLVYIGRRDSCFR